MSPTAPYVSASRRPLDLEDYIDIVRRHRSWIIAPLFAGLVLSVVGGFLWPDTYVSRATMQITPQQVPERIVPSNISSQIGERLTQMQQAILSRASLTALIQKLDLYNVDRKNKPMEDVLEKMKRHVKVTLLDLPSSQAQQQGRSKIASAFQIEYAYTDRYKAQAVVAALVTKFMDQNVQVLRNQSNLTTSFLNDEVNAAKKDLDRLDKEITAFRLQNAGRLPEQLNSNLQTMNSLQMQLASITELLNRGEQEKMMLQTNLQNLKNQLNLVQSTVLEPSSQAKNERLQLLNKAILDNETALAAALQIYKETHPEIRSAKAKLAVLKKERDSLEKQEQEQQAKNEPKPVTNPQMLRSVEDIKSAIASAQVAIRAKDLDLAERRKQQDQIRKAIGGYQARIEVAPLSEQKYTQLTRDYMLAKAKYEEMMLKKSLSETANNMEERKAGENLAVLDDASLPDKPTEPNRIMITGLGAGLGLLFGICIAGAREMKDASLKNLKDVRAYTQLSVLTCVPLLENALLMRRSRRMFWLAWAAAVIVGTLAMSASIYYYYFGRA